MPILEYACKTCEHRFDKFIRGMNVPAMDVECPTCGSANVQKQVSAFGVTGVWQSKVPEFSIPKMPTPSANDPFNCIVP
ncbi:MAG: zinc ribbon domain-containing protein [Chloroflexi bacterium]|nr:zinc ribbon domain-containing protein [Chloroflexota bacterium]